ncbi:hypothetical protein Y032_0006g2815 [Ancylostoma ceylanicum]|uniref:Uncharacterized protein n=1 Tax=Ancylostoma ceylanicum TaxID=53326 RepID=A0A016VP23_9BILA|nr:hypothetical protein Y032_0006g2815 [Ancylostoma ceylanicum]
MLDVDRFHRYNHSMLHNLASSVPERKREILGNWVCHIKLFSPIAQQQQHFVQFMYMITEMIDIRKSIQVKGNQQEKFDPT